MLKNRPNCAVAFIASIFNASVLSADVTHLIDLGAMGNPVQMIEAKAYGPGARVTWTVTSDMGFNPVFRIFGLFMDRMLGKTFEPVLHNIKAPA